MFILDAVNDVCLVTLSVKDELRHTGIQREASHHTEGYEVALHFSVQKHQWCWTFSCSALSDVFMASQPAGDITPPSLKV